MISRDSCFVWRDVCWRTCLFVLHSFGQKQVAEALRGELVDLVAVVLDLVGDEQRLEARHGRHRLEYLVDVLVRQWRFATSASSRVFGFLQTNRG